MTNYLKGTIPLSSVSDILLRHGYNLKSIIVKKADANIYHAEKTDSKDLMKLEEYLGKSHSPALLNYNTLKHQNLLPYVDCFEELGRSYFVSNITWPNALKFIRLTKIKDTNDRELLVGKWINQMVNALLYCHSFSLYQTDFDWRDTVVNLQTSDLMITSFDSMSVNSSCGELQFPEKWKRPPEMLHPGGSMGVTVQKIEAWVIGYEVLKLLVGCSLGLPNIQTEQPSKLSNCQIWKHIRQNLALLPTWFEASELSVNARSFLLSLLEQTSRKRKDLETVSNHPWLTHDVPKDVHFDFKTKQLLILTHDGKKVPSTHRYVGKYSATKQHPLSKISDEKKTVPTSSFPRSRSLLQERSRSMMADDKMKIGPTKDFAQSLKYAQFMGNKQITRKQGSRSSINRQNTVCGAVTTDMKIGSSSGVGKIIPTEKQTPPLAIGNQHGECTSIIRTVLSALKVSTHSTDTFKTIPSLVEPNVIVPFVDKKRTRDSSTMTNLTQKDLDMRPSVTLPPNEKHNSEIRNAFIQTDDKQAIDCLRRLNSSRSALNVSMFTTPDVKNAAVERTVVPCPILPSNTKYNTESNPTENNIIASTKTDTSHTCNKTNTRAVASRSDTSTNTSSPSNAGADTSCTTGTDACSRTPTNMSPAQCTTTSNDTCFRKSTDAYSRMGTGISCNTGTDASARTDAYSRTPNTMSPAPCTNIGKDTCIRSGTVNTDNSCSTSNDITISGTSCSNDTSAKTDTDTTSSTGTSCKSGNHTTFTSPTCCKGNFSKTGTNTSYSTSRSITDSKNPTTTTTVHEMHSVLSVSKLTSSVSQMALGDFSSKPLSNTTNNGQKKHSSTVLDEALTGLTLPTTLPLRRPNDSLVCSQCSPSNLMRTNEAQVQTCTSTLVINTVSSFKSLSSETLINKMKPSEILTPLFNDDQRRQDGDIIHHFFLVIVFIIMLLSLIVKRSNQEPPSASQ